MPLEVNSLMGFLQQVEDARRRRQQEAQEQAPAAPDMPEWSKRLNPDDFTGTTRDMLVKAQASGPNAALQNPVGRPGQYGNASISDLVDRGGGQAQIYNPVDRMRGGAGADELMGGVRIGDPNAPGTANQMGKGDLDLMPQQSASALPAPMDPGVMRDPNRPQQPPQRQTPEPAAQMPQQQNAAPAAPQGGQPANLRRALGPHVGDGGDFVAMAQRARRTGEMPGGMSGGQGQATATGSGGSDTLAQPTAARGGGGGGLFGGSGPGLGYAIGGIGAMLQEAAGQQGAASRFAQTYGGQFQERREANQTRQLALQLGIPEDIAATAPIDILKPIIGDAYKRSVQGSKPEWEYKDGQWYRIDDQGPTPFGEPNTSAGTPKLATFQQGPDGPVQTLDIGTPEGRAQAHHLMAQGWTESRTPAAQVNIGQSEYGTIPQGYEMVTDPDTGARSLRPIPGGPAEREAESAEEQASMREGAARQTADVVVGAVDTALQQIDENPTATTGLGGQLTNRIGGLPAHDLQNTLNTVKANVGFDKLQKMREASPTGGALGQVSELELQLLNSALGALEQSQSPEQLKTNLARVREIYLDTIHGPGNRPVGGQADAAPAQQQSGVPQGVDPEDWKYMTPEERALWQ